MNNFIIVLTIVAFTPNAYAYIDLGSGSFMLQMFIATLMGLSFTLKMYYKNIKEKIKKLLGFKSELPQDLSLPENEEK